MEDITTLFRKYVERTITPDETARLKAFIAQSAENKQLFANFLALHKTELQADMLTRIDKVSRWETVLHKIRLRQRRRRVVWLSAAAAVVVLIASSAMVFLHDDAPKYATIEAAMEAKAGSSAVLTLAGGETITLSNAKPQTIRDAAGTPIGKTTGAGITYYATPSEPLTTTIAVAEGSTYSVHLTDGTAITLNSGAELTYTIGSTERSVSLNGEGRFEVIHDPQHPFTVSCSDGTLVRVLGTRFNVSTAKGGPTLVTVEEGMVSVVAGEHSVVLKTNGQASVAADKNIEVSEVDAALYTSWADGIYEFTDVPMETIARQLSLWYGIDFVFADPVLKERQFTGALLRDQKLGYSLELLKDVSGISFKMQDGKIVIQKENSNQQKQE